MSNCACTVDVVLDEYLATFSAKTRACYASDLAPARDVFGGRPAGAITKADIEQLRIDLVGTRKTNGPGRGGLRSQRSIGSTATRLWAALGAHLNAGKGRRDSTVYVISAIGTPLVKIGQAVDVAHRLQNLQSGSPVPLVVLGTFEGLDGRDLERALHAELAASRHHGEWFDLGANPLAVVRALVS